MISYFEKHTLEIIAILVSIFIAYHIFFLSRKISNQARLTHKDWVKEKVNEFLSKVIKEGIRRKVYLINVNRYFKDYPSNQEKIISGYSHIRAELKTTRYNGVQFFCGMPEQAYYNKEGGITLKENKGSEAFLVYPVGLVPYDWVEYVDLGGDEYEGVPLFHCKFRGKIYWKKWWRRLILFGYPYKELFYYRKREGYDKQNDPPDTEWVFVQIKK